MDGFLASPVGWGIASLMRKTSIFQYSINVPQHKGKFQGDKLKVQCTCDESTQYCQLNLSSTETSLLLHQLYIYKLCIYAHTHTFSTADTTEEIILVRTGKLPPNS